MVLEHPTRQPRPTHETYAEAMQAAIDAALVFAGATSPNPPVGAAALDAQGEILAVAAHRGKGYAHAEVEVLQLLAEQGDLYRLETMVITLEPCNHSGTTPPCTKALIEAQNHGLKRVIYGVADPNPRVQGGGAKELSTGGLEVLTGVLSEECARLIAPFRTWCLTGRPWVTVKTAYTRTGHMIPPTGRTTFARPESLRLAHLLRKRADAILTGSGTVIADSPAFTVRHVPDHPGKKRWIVVLDRRGHVPEEWVDQARTRGFQVTGSRSLDEAIEFLGQQGVQEVLVEAGPTLSGEILSHGIWNEHVIIRQKDEDTPDDVEVRINANGGASSVHRDY